MVHISDGVLPPAMLVAGFILTAVLLYFSLLGMKAEEIPKVSLITAALFVASLVHFPVGPTSVHLVMNGLAGILLWRRAYAGVFVALTLQAVFFQHGGLTSLGVNAFNIGFPALLAWQLFERRRGINSPRREAVFGGLAGGLAVLGSVLLVSLELLALGEAFREISIILIGAHIPVILVESVVAGGAAGLLMRVMPEMLVSDRQVFRGELI
ncbi:MAG: cobalt transporter CbiM [Methanothrix sp.]